MISVVAFDLENLGRSPEVAQAWADDDGGRNNERGRNRDGFGRGGDDGPTLFRPWRKRKPPIRRSARRPTVQIQYEPGVLVARGLTESALVALGSRGYDILEQHRSSGGLTLTKLRVPRGRSLEEARRSLRTEHPESIIDFNHFYRPEALECSARRCLMRQISGWPADMAVPTCRRPAPVGLIDTRINVGHSSLKGSRITVLSLFDTGTDASGTHHGTAVAALLVGSGDVPGLLHGGELVAVDAFRKGDLATGLDLARAIDVLVERGVAVVNMSLSGPDNAILAASVEDAVKRGMVLVAAAGNDGPKARPVYPAAYSGVIAVTAVDRHKNIYRRAARGAHIDIAAPGVDVWTAASVKGQRPRSGTSFAAPFVAAAAAMILSENPGFGRREIEIVLENEADDLGQRGRDDIFGWGLLDVRKICGS